MSSIDNAVGGEFSVRPLEAVEDLIGNEKAMNRALCILRWQGALPRLALFGPSGSGKSTTVNYVCALAHCHQPTGNVPCGKCKGCERMKVGHREVGIFAYVLDPNRTVHYLPINCRNITPAGLHRELEYIREMEGLRLIHLEEGAELRRLGCDVSLTDIMDDPDFRTCRWFMTAVTEVELDPQFRRRWGVRTVTTPADEKSVARLVAKRCHECKIDIDHPSTFQFLAKKSWGIVGLATAPLSEALVDDPPVLTRKIVEKYPFPSKDPWKQKFLAD
jgi:hypothetical protein